MSGWMTSEQQKELTAALEELPDDMQEKLNSPLAALKFAKLAFETKRLAEVVEGLFVMVLLKGFPNGLTVTLNDAELTEEYELYQSVDSNHAMFLRAAPRPPDEVRKDGELKED